MPHYWDDKSFIISYGMRNCYFIETDDHEGHSELVESLDCVIWISQIQGLEINAEQSLSF